MVAQQDTFLTYINCVSSLVDLLSPISSIESIYTMRGFARGDIEIGKSDIDITIIMKNAGEKILGKTSLEIGKRISLLRMTKPLYKKILSMPKISTVYDWRNTEVLDPAEYGIRDQKEAKRLFGKEIFLEPIIPLCNLKEDILDSLINESVLAMGEATYSLIDNNDNQSYWFWKSIINVLRYFFWLTTDMYISSHEDVLALAKEVFGKNFPFLFLLSKKNGITLDDLVNAYNFLTSVCIYSIKFSDNPNFTTRITDLDLIKPIINDLEKITFIENEVDNWAWEPWLKPELARKFIISFQPCIALEGIKHILEEIRKPLNARRSYPVLIYKSVYEFMINRSNPLLGNVLLQMSLSGELMINPSGDKLRLWNKKIVAYFFYNWMNSYVEICQIPSDQYRLINKITTVQAALINLKTGYVETDPEKIQTRFSEVFYDFRFKEYGRGKFDIRLFPDFIISLRDYFYDDKIKPGLLYSS